MPPSRRGMSDAQARVQAGDSMPDRRQREDTAAIRVSNLSENVQEADLQVSFHSNILDSDSFYYIRDFWLQQELKTHKCWSLCPM